MGPKPRDRSLCAERSPPAVEWSVGRVVGAVILGTLPGVFVVALLRVTVLSDPDAFEVFVGLVLLYFGIRLGDGRSPRLAARSHAGDRGLAGTYAGARLQHHVPERLIRGVRGALVTLLALRYVL